MQDKLIGRYGEQIAADFLRKKGYTILASNYSTRVGEIDLIARKGEIVAFVEVKTRSRDYISRPSEAVTAAKQRKIIKTAQFYLMRSEKELQPRFDVIEIVTASKNDFRVLEIEHIEDAFGV